MDVGDAAALLDDGERRDLRLDNHAQDDVATLSEALALVDECGLVSLEDLGIGGDPLLVPNSSIVSEDTPTGSSSASPRPPEPTANKRSSLRQKEELQYLRSTVVLLEQELALLKKQSTGSNQVATPLVSVWEDIAARQSEERQKAEVENVKLRLLLEEQLRVAKTFERLLKKRSLADYLGPSPPQIGSRSRLVDDTLEGLWDLLHGMHAEVDSILSSDRFASSELPFRDIQVRVDEGFGTVVEAVEKRITPFELEDFAKATWHQMAHHTHADSETHHAHHVHVDDDRFTRDFVIELNSTRTKATFTGTIVAQRFVKDDRVVFVWIVAMKPTQSTDKAEGMRQTAYVVLTKEDDQDVKPATLLRALLAFQLNNSDDEHHSRAVGALTNFVLNSVSLHFEEAKQNVENALLVKSRNSVHY